MDKFRKLYKGIEGKEQKEGKSKNKRNISDHAKNTRATMNFSQTIRVFNLLGWVLNHCNSSQCEAMHM